MDDSNAFLTNTFGVFVCHQYVWWMCESNAFLKSTLVRPMHPDRKWGPMVVTCDSALKSRVLRLLQSTRKEASMVVTCASELKYTLVRRLHPVRKYDPMVLICVIEVKSRVVRLRQSSMNDMSMVVTCDSELRLTLVRLLAIPRDASNTDIIAAKTIVRVGGLDITQRPGVSCNCVTKLVKVQNSFRPGVVPHFYPRALPTHEVVLITQMAYGFQSCYRVSSMAVTPSGNVYQEF